ncbi:MAG: hypothetical protein M1832_003202 [Thelocarpon impressellum]|nr:MAG: hypothetical protein M1832_003202 [Thelocarpon impressellum]
MDGKIFHVYRAEGVQEIIGYGSSCYVVAYIHTKKVIHCDLGTRNLLLDDDLNVKLTDFQGVPPSPGGRLGRESDLFALGTTIYDIMVGHEPFPDLDNVDDQEEIEKRYIAGQFPTVDGVLAGDVIRKCWTLAYQSVDECAEELKALEERSQAQSQAEP